MKPKIIVILGPTASGKSALAIKIAKKFNGEIISADSRQVYKGLNLGTGKVTKKEMLGIPHYLIDVTKPKNVFSVSQFKEITESIIEKIVSRKKVPIICGGTGFYIQSIVDGITPPNVKPDINLRKELSKKTTNELYSMLERLDKNRADEIDKNNKVRLIRSIEIASALGIVPKIRKNPKYNTLQIGIKTNDDVLRERINKRLIERIRKGMVNEVRKLHENGLSWKRMHSLGLEYRYVALYLQNIISKDEMLKNLKNEIWHYARRQKAWFKRDQRIKWFTFNQSAPINRILVDFLNTKNMV